LQAALLEHDFAIQYKKGAIMPADYLSRLPFRNLDAIAAFNQFQADLIDLQKADREVQLMNNF
jgi:hypothetical protein